MIRFDQVSKRYPNGFEALKQISFEVRQGEMAIVTGRSGAGKSTLLKLIPGIERTSGGSVLVGGQNVGQLRPAATAMLRRNIGLVFQDHKLLFDRSVFDNVALPLHIGGYPYREVARRVRAALDKVGLLGREKANPITLSGGEQQRLCIARAIVNRPALLIADEPTGNLDAEYAASIMALFETFNRVGVTVLLSTHDPALADGRRRLHLENGALLP